MFLLAVAGAAAAKAVISWRKIQNWLAPHRIQGGAARIVGERLDSGRYRVVTGVFDASGSLHAHRTWEGASLDSELAAKLERNGSEIVVEF